MKLEQQPTREAIQNSYKEALEETTRHELENDYISADEAEHRAWALVAMYKTLYGEELPENENKEDK